jgi:ribosome-interacting GTPase 1
LWIHYSQPKGEIPDYTAPVVLHDQSPSIEDFCCKLHKQLILQFKYAWVWGSSVRHQPQKCGREHVLCDEDVVQIVKKI